VVDAFFAAAHNGDFDTLLQVLDPDVDLRIDGGTLRREASVALHGARAVAGHTRTYSRLYPYTVPAIVNGAAGVIVAPNRQPYAVMAFTIAGDLIAAIHVLVDPERLNRLLRESF
jgi:RNA polymerase sigma-70 factor (ECF subfamily)